METEGQNRISDFQYSSIVILLIMSSSTSFPARLEALYEVLATLRPDSHPEAFDKFASFFAEDSVAYLKSMREHAEPSIGRAGVIEGIKDVLKDQYLERRHVVSTSWNEQERKVFSEMETRYVVHSAVLDPFYETAVVTFSHDGLITEFKTYSCRSHIVLLIQKQTGVGPYNATELR